MSYPDDVERILASIGKDLTEGTDAIYQSVYHSGIFIISGFLTLYFIAIFACFAPKLGLMDIPSNRKRHEGAVPLVGGIGLFLSTSLCLFFVDVSPELIWMQVFGFALVFVGVIDDAKELRVGIRLAFQVIVVFVLVSVTSIWIKSFGFESNFLDLILDWIGFPLTIFAMVGLINTFNMIDGIDGLASGQFLLGCLSLSLGVLMGHQSLVNFEWLFVFTGSVFAFWLTNLSITPIPPKIFLGDAGSMFLGYALGGVLLYFSQSPQFLIHPVVALWCVTIPFCDCLSVVGRRLADKRSPFSSDRSHLHYLLIDSGLKSNVVLALILCLSVIVNFVGLLISILWSYSIGLFIYLITVCMLAYFVFSPSFVTRVANRLKSSRYY